MKVQITKIDSKKRENLKGPITMEEIEKIIWYYLPRKHYLDGLYVNSFRYFDAIQIDSIRKEDLISFY